jgi:hypothetical protein
MRSSGRIVGPDQFEQASAELALVSAKASEGHPGPVPPRCAFVVSLADFVAERLFKAIAGDKIAALEAIWLLRFPHVDWPPYSSQMWRATRGLWSETRAGHTPEFVRY